MVWRRLLAADRADLDRQRHGVLSSVGHELRAPLTAIKAAVATLRSTEIELSNAEVAELLETIELTTDSLAMMIGRFLEASRLHAGKVTAHPQPCNVRALLTEKHGHLLPNSLLEWPEDFPEVMADPVLLNDVFAVLLENAVLHAGASAQVMVRGVTAGAKVMVEVVDHGPGVPAEKFEELFVPFQRLDDTTTSAGPGLGLSIARGLVELMGGRLTPSETPGGGLTMTIELDRAA